MGGMQLGVDDEQTRIVQSNSIVIRNYERCIYHQHVHTITMLYCLAQAVLLITMMYAGMSDVLHTGTYIRVISGGGERTKCIVIVCTC